jgi:thiol-disulfide isomerase/thioredoxin
MYLLFFSKKCKYSRKFIELLYEIGEEKFFKMVDVAKVNGRYPTLVKQYGITEVPTCLIDGELLVGPVAFKWLESKIKNLNHQVSSQDTRMNKTPTISGYAPDNSAGLLTGYNDNFDGTSSFSNIFLNQSIETPDAGTDYEKTSFILPNDSITGNNDVIKDDRQDRTSKMDQAYEKMLQEREQDVKRRV